MQILKAMGDGIGTGGGVVWSTFGIVFGSLGLAIGASTIAVVLGSISGGAFLLIALMIAYWSYKKHLDEKEELQNVIETQENTLCGLLIEYILSLSREWLLQKNKTHIQDTDKPILVEYIKRKIMLDIKEI